MALDRQINTSDKIRGLVGSFETVGICFDGRSEEIKKHTQVYNHHQCNVIVV